MSIDWDNLEDKMGSKFKPFAEDGKYKVKCIDVEVKEVGSNGSIVQKFIFEEDKNAQFPTADHWLSKKNDNFRAYHQKNLFVVLGATEDQARSTVEKAEEKDFDYAVKFYEKALKNLLAKKPEVEIEVYTQINENTGKEYARAEFTDRSVAMPRDGAKKASDTKSSDEIDLSDLPF